MVTVRVFEYFDPDSNKSTMLQHLFAHLLAVLGCYVWSLHQLRRAELLSSGCVRASGLSGFSRCGTWASGTQASVAVAWQALQLRFSGPGAWAL